MVSICQQDFIRRTRSVAPEGGVVLTKVTKARTRFFFTGEFEPVSTVPGPAALVGSCALRLEDAYVYPTDDLPSALADLMSTYGIGGEPWEVAAVSDFIDIPPID